MPATTPKRKTYKSWMNNPKVMSVIVKQLQEYKRKTAKRVRK